MNSVQVYLGIGSNIDAFGHIEKAIGLLQTQVGSLQRSPTYQNPAEGFEGDDFLNLVVGFNYQGELAELSSLLVGIEQQCGRQRGLEKGKGSRTIDLDLLTFGEIEGEYEGVFYPRREVFSRQFVWQPLLDLLGKKPALSRFEERVKSKIEQSPGILTAPLMRIVKSVAI